MSELLNKAAVKAIVRIGNLMMPKNGELPSYSEYGGVEHVDDILKYVPAGDLGDLNMALTALRFMPTFVLKWLIKKMAGSHAQEKGGDIFRQLDFGLKGIVLSTYYSEKKGSNFKGKTPLEVIGYSVRRVF